jgi:hypothetical protein
MIKEYPVNPKDGKIIYTSSIFDSISYLTLPLSNNTIIGSIDKIEIHKSRYYFWDKTGKKIWCFDFLGNYIFQIDKRGQGPGEYLQIYDFDIDKERQQIQILDRSLRKILCYDLNGNYIKDIKMEVAASQFTVLQDGFLLYTKGVDIFMGRDKNTYGFNLFKSDSVENLQERYFPYNDITENIIGFKTFATHDQQIFFHYARNDTIYEFDHIGHMICKHLFDFGKYRLPLKSISDKQTMSDYDNKSDYTRIFESFSTSQHMFITYIYEMRIRFLLFYKQSKKIINGSFLENDIDGISFANPSPMQTWQNQLIYIKEVSDIVDQKKDGKYLYESIPQLRHLKENDNPVIVIAFLKNNEN